MRLRQRLERVIDALSARQAVTIGLLAFFAGLLAIVLSASFSHAAQPKQPQYEYPGLQVAATAASMLGRPYGWGQADPVAGFDCSGLAWYAYKAIGVNVPRTVATLAEQVQWSIPGSDLQPGDLVFFNTLDRQFSHVGVYLGHRVFIHAPGTGRVVRVAQLDNPFWYKRYDGARRPSLPAYGAAKGAPF